MKTMKKSLPMGGRLLVPNGIDANGKVKYKALNIPAGTKIVVTSGASPNKKVQAQKIKRESPKKDNYLGVLFFVVVMIFLIIYSFLTS